ncbi:MAG: dihydropteroate synthase [Pirellulales bacterium]
MTSSDRPPVAERFPGRAGRWQLRSRGIELPARPLLMGILNVTPDSFSDGGRFLAGQAAIEHGLRLAAEGADLIDVGGESTRPYSQPVEAAEELRRVIGVVQALAEQTRLPISIDTSKPEVAREAVAAGAEVINDVTALADPRMVEVALETGAGVCAMHMRGTPQTMQDNPTYGDVVAEVRAYLRARRDALMSAGLDATRLALDPGIGFGKTHQHNLELLANSHRFHALGCPLVVGHSRKGFIAKVIGDQAADRTAGTIGVAISLALQGVQVIRVHDVGAVRQALLLFEATGGLGSSA